MEEALKTLNYARQDWYDAATKHDREIETLENMIVRHQEQIEKLKQYKLEALQHAEEMSRAMDLLRYEHKTVGDIDPFDTILAGSLEVRRITYSRDNVVIEGTPLDI